MKRCDWVTEDPLYIQYHDHEWGVPIYDDKKLFEMLILEGMQAGLNWLTVLRKRENFRLAFDNFNPQTIAQYKEKKILSLLQDAGIIRNNKKISAAQQNAIAFLKIQKEFGHFNKYIWQFVGGEPIKNRWRSQSEVPAATQHSEAMSKDLKKRGFSFVGSTICYAFMQAVGMVNDHVTTCYRYKEINAIQKKKQTLAC